MSSLQESAKSRRSSLVSGVDASPELQSPRAVAPRGTCAVRSDGSYDSPGSPAASSSAPRGDGGSSPSAAPAPPAAPGSSRSLYALPAPPNSARASADGNTSRPEASAESAEARSGGAAPPAGRAGAPSDASWVRRVQGRSEELRRSFRLPPEEQLVDEYLCALKKKVLLQGKLYVFEDHLAFHCNLFGYQKDKVIPLKEVTNVRKRTNVGFPNSIEITLESGKREFFTSFLSREDCFRLVTSLWRQCSRHAPPPGSSDEDVLRRKAERAERLQHPSTMTRLIRTVTSRHKSSEPAAHGDAHGGRADTPGVLSDDGLTDGGGAADRGGALWSPRTISRRTSAAHSQGGQSGPRSDREDDANDEVPPEDGSPGRREFDDLACGEGAADCVEMVEKEFAGSDEPPPPLEPDMKPLLEYVLPCSPAVFWRRFLSNRTDFFAAFHRSVGDSDVSLSRWQRHYKLGWVRDLQFVTPLKMKMGPPKTLCIQAQRFKVYHGWKVVFETSQVMTDIPYGDHFKVESRWDVQPSGDDSCRVQVHIRVPFYKSTMWRKFIERGVMDNCHEAFSMWKQMAEGQLVALMGPQQAGAGPVPEQQGGAPRDAASRAAQDHGSLGRPPTGLRRRGPPAPRSRGHRRSVSGEAFAAMLEAHGVVPPANASEAAAAGGMPIQAAARTRRSPTTTLLCLLAAVIIALQALLLLQLRRGGPAPPPALSPREGESPDAAALRSAVAGELAGVLRELAELQAQGAALRGRVDGLLRSSASLAERADDAMRSLAGT